MTASPRPSPDDETRLVDPADGAAWRDSSPPTAGAPRRIGAYELGDELGRGSMAVVYLARHTSLDRQVALKLLPQTSAYDDASRERFFREARALARIEHPHVVRVHDVLVEDANLAIAMERIEGPSLAQVIAALRQDVEGRRRTPSLHQVAAILGVPREAMPAPGYLPWVAQLGRSLASALDAVHAAGLTHRDIKPSNVLLDLQGHAHLADFGVVRDPESALTHSGGFVGTGPYASPEQLRGDDDVGERSDVYNLGATLYELACLEQPVSGSPMAILEVVARGAVPPIESRGPFVARDLALIIHHAIEPEPDRRYQSAAAMAADLAAFVEARPIGVRPTGWTERLFLWMRRERARAQLAGVALIAAVAITGAVGWSLYQLPRIEIAEALEMRDTFDALVHAGYARLAGGHADAGRPFREALAIYPQEPIAIGGLALALAADGRRRDAVELLASRPELVAKYPGLAYLHEVEVDIWRRPPGGDAKILDHSQDALECFFAGLAARERARSLRMHAASSFVHERYVELMDGVAALFFAAYLSERPSPRIFGTELATASALGRVELQRNAVRILAALAEETPDSTPLALRRAQALLDMGLAQQALEVTTEAAFRQADPAIAAVLRGRILLALERPADAIAALRSPRADDEPEVQLCLATAHHAAGDASAERAAYERASDLLGARFDAAVAAGRPTAPLVGSLMLALRNLKRREELSEYLRRSTAADPEDALSHVQLALDLGAQCRRLRGSERSKLEAQTLAHLHRAVELRRYDYRVTLAAIQIFAGLLGDYERALPHIERILEITPNDPSQHEGHFAVLYDLGRFAEAVEPAARLRELKPDDETLRLKLGFCLLFAGREIEARAELADFAKTGTLQQNDTWEQNATIALAALELRHIRNPGRIDAARAWLAGLVDSVRHNNPLAVAVDGEIAFAADDVDEARRFLERADGPVRATFVRGIGRGDARRAARASARVDRCIEHLRTLLANR